jgi:hypothetical protein
MDRIDDAYVAARALNRVERQVHEIKDASARERLLRSSHDDDAPEPNPVPPLPQGPHDSALVACDSRWLAQQRRLRSRTDRASYRGAASR